MAPARWESNTVNTHTIRAKANTDSIRCSWRVRLPPTLLRPTDSSGSSTPSTTVATNLMRLAVRALATGRAAGFLAFPLAGWGASPLTAGTASIRFILESPVYTWGFPGPGC
jgi:hypothetical protein